MRLKVTIDERGSEESMLDSNSTTGLPQDLAVRVLKVITAALLFAVPTLASATTMFSSPSRVLMWSNAYLIPLNISRKSQASPIRRKPDLYGNEAGTQTLN